MASHGFLKRAVSGLALLAVLAVVSDADAQNRRRMPVRTDPIPDTETGAKAGTAGADDPPKSQNMIYGPPTPVLGAPPSPAAPEPVVTPVPAAPAPVAVPVPAPAPAPAPVAVPAPAPAPVPEPVATPVPAQVEPTAVPIPAPAPVAVPVPAPAPPPTPVAVPATVVAPPPAPVAAPVVIPTPAPAPVAVPAAAPPARTIAAIAPPAAPYTSPRLDAKLVEQIFSCLAPGLPQDWKRAWFVVPSAPGTVPAKFFYTSSYRDEDAEEFVPCNVQEITRRITGLTESLPPTQRGWKSARLAINSEGEYELVYDYAK